MEQTFEHAILSPPKPNKNPRIFSIHDTTLHDDYFWLRERENPDVMTHLLQENSYTNAALLQTSALQEELFAELKSRVKEQQETYPDKMGDYWYYSRFEAGKQYAMYCRKYLSLEAPEEIILDANILAEKEEYFALGTLKISPDHRFLAYSYDIDGSEYFRIAAKDIQSGNIDEFLLENTDGSVEWTNDCKGFYYLIRDAAFRPFRVQYHSIGRPADSDVEIYRENDEAFWLDISTSRDKSTIFISCGSSITSECLLVPAEQHSASTKPTVFIERKSGVEYTVEIHRGQYYMLTNADAKNFMLLQSPVSEHTRNRQWKTIIAAHEERTLSWHDVVGDYIVVCELHEGLQHLRFQHSRGEFFYAQFPDEAYSFSSGHNYEAESSCYRISYSSPVTPPTIYDFDFAGKTLLLRKQKEIPGFDADSYRVERLFAKTCNGENIPITLVRRADDNGGAASPCLLYGYGAYGISMTPNFKSSIFSLLDRGFVYATAHIRGGREMGEHWHESGKMLNKRNTFSDFISCAEYLVEQGITKPSALIAEGASAGGLLMGAIANMRPDLFQAVVAHVPFVDVVNTMLDPGLPLTVSEWEEWGNPTQKEFFDYISSYSPYDNIQPNNYPHILAIAGLSDPRVSYWEPAKWIAKLRDHNKGKSIMLLKTNLESGHFGATGRFNYLREIARDYAFMMMALTLPK